MAAGATAHQMVAVDLPRNAPDEFLPQRSHSEKPMRRFWITTSEAADLYADLGIALGLA